MKLLILPRISMNGTPRMKLICLVALCLFGATASAWTANIFSRTRVSGEGRVDMELVEGAAQEFFFQYSYRTWGGVKWVFYREPARSNDTEQAKLAEFLGGGSGGQAGDVKFDDSRVCLFLPQGADCVVVTLDLSPPAPRVWEDRFVGIHGWGCHAALKEVDELEIYNVYALREHSQRLQRGKDGTWFSAGQPLPAMLKSQPQAVPLPPLQTKPAQSYASSYTTKESAWTALYYAACRRLSPTNSNEPSLDVVTLDIRAYHEHWHGYFAKKKRLECINAFSAFNVSHTLEPALENGPDLDMPTMLPAIPPHGMECRVFMTNADAILTFCYHPLFNHGWITAADLNLPCYDTDYHKMVRFISRSYDYWKEYHDERLLQSMSSVDDPAFLFVGQQLAGRMAH